MTFKSRLNRNRLFFTRFLIYLLLFSCLSSILIIELPAQTYSSVPRGLIAFYNGTVASIPSGWYLCNGSNGTPNLLHKFLVGAAALTEANGTVGSDTHGHTELAAGSSHTHDLASAGSHTHTTNISGVHNHGAAMGMTDELTGDQVMYPSDSGGHAHTANAAGDHSHTSGANSSAWYHNHTLNSADDLPPYYELLPIQASASAAVFSGLILAYNGTVASIPSGWLLCNGSSSTPNLLEKFIRGAGSGESAGGTGGAATHTHTTTTAGAHTQSASSSSGAHSHSFNQYQTYHDHGYTTPLGMIGATMGVYVAYQWLHTHASTDSIGAHTHTLASSGDHTHSPVAASSLPAYVDLLYIYCSSATNIPLNAVVIWVGNIAEIPSDYFLCNGTIGTLDLREKYVRAAASGSGSGGTGGSNTHTHTDSSSGAHTHSQDAFSTAHQHANTDTIGAHTHGTFSDSYVNGPYDIPFYYSIDQSGGAHSHSFTNDAWSHTHSISSTGAHTHTINSASSQPASVAVQFVIRMKVPDLVSSSVGQTTKEKDATTTLYSFWVGFDLNLSGYIFSWNLAGAGWVNETWVSFAALNNSWANVSKILSYALGSTILWKTYANASSGVWNATAQQTFTVQATITFYFNSGGEFDLNGTDTANASSIIYTATTTLELAGIVEYNYTFLSFNWSYGATTLNPYNFSVSNMTDLWCMFSGAGGALPVDEFFGENGFAVAIILALVFGVSMSLILLYMRRKRSE